MTPATRHVVGGRWDDVREAALDLLAEHGYHGMTMKLVAGRLGVRAPSLYNHVTSKQEILARIVVEGMDTLLEHQDRAMAGSDDPEQQLRAMAEAHALLSIRRRRTTTIGTREFPHLEEPARSRTLELRAAYLQRYRDVIARGAAAGTFHVESPKLASYAIVEMASSPAVWFREDGTLTDVEVARAYGAMALRIAGA